MQKQSIRRRQTNEQRQWKQNRKLFTLIELLIVIAMIAILAGMLLPALNQAKESARSTGCIGNLKQLGYVNALYCNDFNEWGPAGWWVYHQNDSSSSYRWYYLLENSGYMNSKNRSNANRSPTLCPTTAAKFSKYINSQHRGLSYTINNVLTSSGADHAKYPFPASCPTYWEDYKQGRSNFMMPGRAKRGAQLAWYLDATNYGGDGFFILPHRNKVNFVTLALNVSSSACKEGEGWVDKPLTLENGYFRGGLQVNNWYDRLPISFKYMP